MLKLFVLAYLNHDVSAFAYIEKWMEEREPSSDEERAILRSFGGEMTRT
jgi:hypothetical protein